MFPGHNSEKAVVRSMKFNQSKDLSAQLLQFWVDFNETWYTYHVVVHMFHCVAQISVPSVCLSPLFLCFGRYCCPSRTDLSFSFKIF